MSKPKKKGLTLKKCKMCPKKKLMTARRVTCSSRCSSKYAHSSERIAKYRK